MIFLQSDSTHFFDSFICEMLSSAFQNLIFLLLFSFLFLSCTLKKFKNCFRTFYDGYTCSHCMLAFPRKTVLRGCRKCDYDICRNCDAENAKRSMSLPQTRPPSVRSSSRAGTFSAQSSFELDAVEAYSDNSGNMEDNFRMAALETASSTSSSTNEEKYKQFPPPPLQLPFVGGRSHTFHIYCIYIFSMN
jgi:hypothetical protein